MAIKIAFWRTVGDSFEFVFSNWGRLYRLAAVWVAISFVLFVCLAALFGLDAVQKTEPGSHEPLSLGRGVSGFVFLVYSLIAYVAFAVAWHRAVLLGETAEPMRAVRFKWREMRFLMYSIVIGLLSFGVFLAAILIVGGVVALLIVGGGALSDLKFGGGAWATVGVAAFVAIIVAVPFLARFSLGLPAIAVEEPEGVFGRSWHRGWRNGWRLIWGPFLCSLPLAIVSGIFQGGQLVAFQLAAGSGAGRVIGLVLLLICYLLATTAYFFAVSLAVSFLSLTYRQLVPSNAATSAPAT